MPKSWRLLFKEANSWTSVSASSGYGTSKDTVNRVRFEPVLTSALRLEVELQSGFSGGVLEWRVDE